MSIVFQYPTWFLVLAPLAGAAYALGMYFRDRRTSDLPNWLRWGLASVRGITVTLIAVLLIGPMIRSTSHRVERPIILMARDNSSSVLINKDSAYYRTAFQAQMTELTDDLSKDFDVRSYVFGNGVKESGLPDYKDGRTDFSELFDKLEALYVNRNVGAVILASDGMCNQGKDPIYTPLGLNAPVYSVAMGDTTAMRDVVLKKVDHNRYAYLGNEFPVEMTIGSEKFAGKEVKVTISSKGDKLWEKNVKIGQDVFSTVLSAKLKTSEAGLIRYRASVSTLKGELTTENNSQDFLIEVLDGRQRVLILSAAPHPDVAALRRSISGNDNYQVEALLLGEKEIDPEKYDLIILHQLPQINGKGKQDIERVLASNVPLMCVVGPKTDLNRFNEMNLGLQIRTTALSQNVAQPIMAPGFSLFEVSDGLRRVIGQFPPLNVPFGEYVATVSAQPMFNQKLGNVETGSPLVIFNDVSGRKTCVLAGEGIWRWRVTDFRENGSHEVFDRMLSNMVQFLAMKTDRRRFRVTAAEHFEEDEPVVLRAELYNNIYEPINDPEVDLTITDEDGKDFKYRFNRTETAYRLDAGRFKQGNFTYIARTKSGDQVYEATGKFIVSALQMESVRTRADHALMYSIAKNSGGMMFYPHDLKALAQAIRDRKDIRNVSYDQTWFKEAIHMKWLFFMLLALLSLEWFVRKRKGAY